MFVTLAFSFYSCGQASNSAYKTTCNGKAFAIEEIVSPGLSHNEVYYRYQLSGHPFIELGDRRNVDVSEPVNDTKIKQ